MMIHHYCDPISGLEVEIDDHILTQMLDQCTLSKDLETGGILVGYYDDNLKKAIIIRSSNAPKDSKHSKMNFYRGVEGMRVWIQDMWNKEKAFYLGEWHFHPYSSSELSWLDHKQMQKIANDTSIHCPEPVLLIIGGCPPINFSVNVYIFQRNSQMVRLNHYSIERI